MAGIPANAGAVAGVELGHSCDEGAGDASAALSAPKDGDCDLRRAFGDDRPMFCAHATADR